MIKQVIKNALVRKNIICSVGGDLTVCAVTAPAWTFSWLSGVVHCEWHLHYLLSYLLSNNQFPFITSYLHT